MRPHSVINIRTEHVSCELLAATHTHNTLHCTCTFLHSAHNKRVMIFLDTASTTHAPRASNRFSHALRASTVLYCARTRNREHKWLHLCSLLRWHCNLTFCTVSCSRRIINSTWTPTPSPSSSPPPSSPPPSPPQTPLRRRRRRCHRRRRRRWTRRRRRRRIVIAAAVAVAAAAAVAANPSSPPPSSSPLRGLRPTAAAAAAFRRARIGVRVRVRVVYVRECLRVYVPIV